MVSLFELEGRFEVGIVKIDSLFGTGELMEVRLRALLKGRRTCCWFIECCRIKLFRKIILQK